MYNDIDRKTAPPRHMLDDLAAETLPAMKTPEVYSTFDCRIGRHPFCAEGTAREPDPEVPQVTYLPCGCECHGLVGAR